MIPQGTQVAVIRTGLLPDRQWAGIRQSKSRMLVGSLRGDIPQANSLVFRHVLPTVINGVRDGVMSDSDEPLLQGVPTIPPDQQLDGQFLPLLHKS